LSFVNALEFCISVWTPAHPPGFVYESVIIPTDGEENCFIELTTQDWETHRGLFRKGVERFGELRCDKHRRPWTVMFHRKKNGTAADDRIQDEEEMKLRKFRTFRQFQFWDFKDE
jgi:hypothetical protein